MVTHVMYTSNYTDSLELKKCQKTQNRPSIDIVKIYGATDQCRNVEPRQTRSGTSTESFNVFV